MAAPTYMILACHSPSFDDHDVVNAFLQIGPLFLSLSRWLYAKAFSMEASVDD
jgi:hypothetical protein